MLNLLDEVFLLSFIFDMDKVSCHNTLLFIKKKFNLISKMGVLIETVRYF